MAFSGVFAAQFVPRDCGEGIGKATEGCAVTISAVWLGRQ